MVVQLIKNRYDNIMVPTNISLKQLVQNPITVATKAETPLWQFYTTNNHKRCNTSYDDFYALTLDYDKGIATIDKFIDTFKDISFILYTTYSHTPDHHKFRVVIPLNKSHKYSKLINPDNGLISILVNYFQQPFGDNALDRTSFTNFQAIPVYGINPEDYRYHINSTNNKLSLSIFKEQILHNQYMAQLNNIINNNPNSTDKVSRYVYKPEGNYYDFTKAYIDKHVTPFMDAIRWNIDGQYERNNCLVVKCGEWKKYATSKQLDLELIRRTVLRYLKDRNHIKMVNKYVR